MNKILYSPKEGTTGFWGLREVPTNRPVYPSANQDTDRAWKRYESEAKIYNAALESCKEKKLEILGMEDLPMPIWDSFGKHLTEGTIFDLPIGYDFKEELQARESWHNSLLFI